MILDLSLSDNIFETNLLSCALQEIEILFDTFNCELLGNPSFGTNFEQFLWQLTPATSALKKYIIEKINDTYFLSKMNYDVEVNLYKGEIRMIYDVQIHIEDNRGNKTTRK